eukprot:symbB.v1.2.015546.t1/scaffold1164.1/size134582/1
MGSQATREGRPMVRMITAVDEAWREPLPLDLRGGLSELPWTRLCLGQRHWVPQVRPLRGGSVAPVQRLGLRFFSKVDVPTPELGGESITEGTIAEWNAKVGENVKKDQVIATIETDKVTVDVKAPQDGQLLEIKLQADETCEVGQVLAVLGPPGEGGAVAPDPSPAAGAAAEATPAPAATPAAAKPAPKPAAKAEVKTANQASTASPPSSPERGERREKMTRMRQAIARNLKESQNTLAMLTTFQEVDMSGLIKMRKEYKDIFQASHGAKLGFQSPFFLASAYALKQIPALNAYIDNSSNEIVYRDYINIGFAAATPKGLVTPVIKNLETKNLAEVESEFAKFANLAKQDKLTMDDITGNTFTITNGGQPIRKKNTFLDDVLEDSSPESARNHVERSTCPVFSQRIEASSFEAPPELLEPIRAPWPSEMTTMDSFNAPNDRMSWSSIASGYEPDMPIKVISRDVPAAPAPSLGKKTPGELFVLGLMDQT